MTFMQKALSRDRPESINDDVILPRRQEYHPSPVDWRDEVLYFLLVDRFSDGRERDRKLLDRSKLPAARPDTRGMPWSWQLWAESGSSRWQGGSLKGVLSKLGYLKSLGVTALWLSPVFRQRIHEGSYHGYGVQDFLDVDPRFGSRRDLTELVAEAHKRGMRIILDIIFNHSGCNWLYPAETTGGIHEDVSTTDRYKFGYWRGAAGDAVDHISGPEAGVWPPALQ